MTDDNFVCEGCSDRKACEARQIEESWIYSDQFALCCDLTVPEYHDNDWWVLRACGAHEKNCPDITDEELMLANREAEA